MYSTRCKLVTAAVGVLVIIAIALAVVFSMSNGDSGTPGWVVQNRLPFSVVPSRYDILLHPDIDENAPTFGNFTGTVKIEIELKEDREWFVFHAKYLDIQKVVLSNSKGSVDLKAPEEVPKNEWWVVWPANGAIPKGSYTLRVDFRGELTRSIVGFYRSVYTDENNTKRYIATTKFEPTYARLAFPCFDEPAMKASYKVRLVKPSSSEYIALSNSDWKNETTDHEKKLTTVEFAETVKMSSYLAAFIVCDFKNQSQSVPMGNRTLPISIYARQQQLSNTNEALSVSVHSVQFYAHYFGIEYPMPKVDLIAIPDFVSGAMENWGLITFRETSVLFDPQQNAPVNQEAISETTAHELAHMWFGNLVTMKWWTDLWLNEGFATFMAQKSVAAMHADWDYTNQFIVDTLLSVLKLDAVLSSHPVLQEVSNPDQITEIFDRISYDKGSSVILMLEAFMGEDNFKKGLNLYLKTHQYNNAETADLWRALQDYAPDGVDVARVMDSWTRQMGFPLVTLSRAESGFTVTQKRFLSNRDAKYDPSTSKYGYKWEIPLFYSTSASKSTSLVWLHSDEENVQIPGNASIKWIKVNHNQRGYYRVNYDDEGWKSLIHALSENVGDIDSIDRAGLISDAFSLADAEEIKYETALDLTKYLTQEDSFVVWDATSTVFSTLLSRLPKSESLKTYVQKQINPVVSSVSWTVPESDSHLKKRLRALVLGLACAFKSPTDLREANKLFDVWLNGGEKPHPVIRSVVYRYGLGNSESEVQWNQLFKKFVTESNTQERVKLMYALATTPNVTLLQKYLQLAKDESVIRSQDYFSVLSYILENPEGVQLVWDFYRDEYDYLLKRFTLNDRIFGRFIASIAGKFDTETKLKEIEDFFEKYPEAGAGAAARKQAVEGVKNRIKWLSTHKKTVEDWLASA